MFGFPLVVLMCIGPLGCYHGYLVCKNATTAEEIKEPYGSHNPFDRGLAHNCQEVCCVKIDETHRVSRRSVASEEAGTAAILPSVENEKSETGCDTDKSLSDVSQDH